MTAHIYPLISERPKSSLPLEERVQAAVEVWGPILGPESVRCDQATLAEYSRTTSTFQTRPHAVVLPQSDEQVQQIVRVANELRIPLYPISRGCNWGYGDANAVTDGQVIVDLRGMNQILHVDDELAYAVVQPGVTQKQLSDELAQNHPGLWMDCTGAGPMVSVVGNVLERGFGHSPYGDRSIHVAGLRAVLADGSILDTGFGHYDNAKATYVYPYGIGPSLGTLFTQSNFGIVTRMGLWLIRRPEKLVMFLCILPDDELLGPTVEALRELRLEGVLRSSVHIGNDLRVIASQMSFPQEHQAHPPLERKTRERLRREHAVGAWTVSGALYGTKAQVKASARRVRERLGGRKRRLIWLDGPKLSAAQWMIRQSLFRRLGAGRLATKVKAGQAIYDIHRGIPSAEFLAGSFWRHPDGIPRPMPAETDVAASGCAFRWVSPVIPLRASDVYQVLRLANETFERHRFDFFATLTTLTERSLVGIFNLAFDQSDPDEVSRANECYTELNIALAEAGYYPYRASLTQMRGLHQRSQTFWPTVRQLKQALDPNNIIAPGRYDPLVFGETSPR